MNSGVVVHIVVGAEERGPVEEVSAVRAVAGLGLEGDRYYRRHANGDHNPENEITLVTLEGIQAAARDAGFDLTPLDVRRNIVTQGIDLDRLIGSKVRVGEVEIEALGPNPPCRYLQELVEKPLLKPMIGRGGVRGRIVTSGTIKVGDSVIGER
ncbi:MAG TPA: MOSC domain-containing protein [Fimbriimonadaceae bacterium]|nr:MOSC domain-containing protein [Fimbriimonadaceae bacterium]